jgi:hypothetical protein
MRAYLCAHSVPVQARIFIASLAFFRDQARKKKPKTAELDLSSKQAWQTLKTAGSGHRLGGEHNQSATQGSRRAATVLSTLGIKDLDAVPPKNAAARGLELR